LVQRSREKGAGGGLREDGAFAYKGVPVSVEKGGTSTRKKGGGGEIKISQKKKRIRERRATFFFDPPEETEKSFFIIGGRNGKGKKTEGMIAISRSPHRPQKRLRARNKPRRYKEGRVNLDPIKKEIREG